MSLKSRILKSHGQCMQDAAVARICQDYDMCNELVEQATRGGLEGTALLDSYQVLLCLYPSSSMGLSQEASPPPLSSPPFPPRFARPFLAWTHSMQCESRKSCVLLDEGTLLLLWYLDEGTLLLLWCLSG